MHTHTYTYTHKHIHTCAHTHTHMCTLPYLKWITSKFLLYSTGNSVNTAFLVFQGNSRSKEIVFGTRENLHFKSAETMQKYKSAFFKHSYTFKHHHYFSGSARRIRALC